MEILMLIPLGLAVFVGMSVMVAGVVMLAFTVGATVQHHITFAKGGQNK